MDILKTGILKSMAATDYAHPLWVCVVISSLFQALVLCTSLPSSCCVYSTLYLVCSSSCSNSCSGLCFLFWLSFPSLCLLNKESLHLHPPQLSWEVSIKFASILHVLEDLAWMARIPLFLMVMSFFSQIYQCMYFLHPGKTSLKYCILNVYWWKYPWTEFQDYPENPNMCVKVQK